MKGDTEGDTYMLFGLEGVWYTMYICTMNSEVQRQTGLLPTLSRLRLFLLTSHIFTIGLDFHTLLCQGSPLLSLNHLEKKVEVGQKAWEGEGEEEDQMRKEPGAAFLSRKDVTAAPLGHRWSPGGGHLFLFWGWHFCYPAIVWTFPKPHDA